MIKTKTNMITKENTDKTGKTNIKTVFTVSDALGALLYIIAAGLLINCFRLCAGSDIWYDEIFSMEFVTRPMSEMLAIAAQDVHPPLYYIIVRLAEVIAGGLNITDSIAVAKFMSVMPYVLLMIYAITILRKKFSMLTAGLFTVMVVGMPQMYDMTVEIRMYSWALFFVTAAFIHGILFLQEHKTDQAVILLLYGTAACYTHYYALIATYALYLGIFIWIIVDNKLLSHENSVLHKSPEGGSRNIMISIALPFITAIFYLPWIRIAMSQTATVSENYWIQPVSLRTIPGCAKYMLLGTFNSAIWGYIFAALAACMILVAVAFAISKIREWISKAVLLGIFVLVMLILGGLVLSVIIRPVFVYRYMIPALGVFWLAIAISVGSQQKKYLSIAGALIFVIISLRDYQTFNWSENYKKELMASADVTLSQITDDTIIICNFNHIQALSSFYLNNFYEKEDNVNQIYAYQTEPETLIPVMLEGIEVLGDDADSQIVSFLEQGKKVLFFGSFNSREDIVSAWDEQYGITSTYLTECMVERYWFNVYELSLSE